MSDTQRTIPATVEGIYRPPFIMTDVKQDAFGYWGLPIYDQVMNMWYLTWEELLGAYGTDTRQPVDIEEAVIKLFADKGHQFLTYEGCFNRAGYIRDGFLDLEKAFADKQLEMKRRQEEGR